MASIFRDLESLQAAVMMEGRRIKLGVGCLVLADCVDKRFFLAGFSARMEIDSRSPILVES